jgi:alpha-beta hydrolase superfamily lysophospholipase
MLLLHGEDDPICPAAGSRALFEQLEDGRAKLATYPGLLHEIFNEPGYERIFEDLLEWVRSLPG